MTKLDELQKAIEEAAATSQEMIRKSQMTFDFTAPNPHAHDHHVAYTRTNASGTVSNIKVKGSAPAKPQIDHEARRQKKLTYFADTKSSEAFSSSELHDHRKATEAHRTAAEAYPRGSKQRAYHNSAANNHSDIAERLDAEYTQSANIAADNADIAYDPQPGDDAPLKNPQDRYNKPAGVHSDTAFDQIKAAGGANVHTTSGHIEYYFRGDKRQLAHKDAADGHRYVNPAELKQHLDAMASNDKSNKPGADSHTAAKLLQRVADKHSNNMYGKADSFKDTHGNYELPASAVAGNEAREYKTTDVYGNNSQRHQGQLVPGGSEFSPEFQKIQEEHGHNSFILNHNGHRYLVDPQGYSYARYITHIKEEPKGTKPSRSTAELPSDVTDAYTHASITSADAWDVDKENAYSDKDESEAVQKFHDQAEAALVHAANLHEQAANKVRVSNQHAARNFERNAAHMLKMAEEHGARSHSIWVAQQQAKQVASPDKPAAAPAKPIKVDVDTSNHFRSHMKEPKGRGGWMFSPTEDIDFTTAKHGEDYITTPYMTYTDAKKYAKEWAAKKGHTVIHVMP